MYVCMFVCMCVMLVCMYVCMYVRIYVSMYVCMHAYTHAGRFAKTLEINPTFYSYYYRHPTDKALGKPVDLTLSIVKPLHPSS